MDEGNEDMWSTEHQSEPDPEERKRGAIINSIYLGHDYSFYNDFCGVLCVLLS